MMELFKEQDGGVHAGDVLAFIAEAAERRNDAAVPFACLPVLSHAVGRRSAADGVFVFALPSKRCSRCGWGERVAAGVLLILAAPALILMSLLVLLIDGRPVLFRQQRFGYEGASFTILKFRTMKRHSERLQGKLQRRLGADDQLFKLEHDPRVTKLGVILRHTFIDELPQLINVVRGEMRLVGPRPLPASDQGHYTQLYHALRLQGMPGMTGLWQVSERNRLTFDELCLLDYYYLCNRSLGYDLWLILRTMGVVLEQIGLKRKPKECREGHGCVERADQKDNGHNSGPCSG